MTAGSTRTRRTRAPDTVDHVPDWSPAETGVGVGLAERMFTLAYRVARGVGYSPRASQRLCQRVFRAVPSWLDTPSVADPAAGGRTRVDPGRRTRARLVAALRAVMPSHVDRRLLDRALQSAVLADELTLLPPRQQTAVRWALQQQCTVGQISECTGWTPQQVARLLRAGLTTLTVCGQPNPPA